VKTLILKTSFSLRTTLPLCLGMALLPAAQAQSYCASDGQPAPTALLERFINADCAACWRDPATPQASPRTAVLDWVVPGSQGDDAPLSAVAVRDAQARLDALAQARPTGSASLNQPNLAHHTLRVSRGLPFVGYLGVSIEMTPALPGPWQATLALVENLPAGTEGSPVARALVRNALVLDWGRSAAANAPAERYFDSRAMGIPSGANPERLGLVGWVQNAKGQVVALAQAGCELGEKP